jgi:1-acyl-sn-glycerol-3-phosphate acyltransferase
MQSWSDPASAHRVLAWPATLALAVLFALILLIFEPMQRVARRLGTRAHDRVSTWIGTSMVAAFHVTGMRVSVERSPRVAEHTPYLVVANHQSIFDIALLLHLFRSSFPKFVAKRELARYIPSVSFNLRHGGSCIIDRSDPEQAVAAIAELGRRVEQRSVSAIIFPEGTRSREGALQPFKPRGLLALLSSAPATPVVPVTIDASWELMQHGFWPVPYGVHVQVRIDAPIPRAPGEDLMPLVERLQARIATNLRRMRIEAERRVRGGDRHAA